MGRRSAEYQGNGSECPDCGSVVFSLHGHRGKKTCQAWAVERLLKADGYVNVNKMTHPVTGVPASFRRFIRRELTGYRGGDNHTRAKIVKETWLPKWVCALINAGYWTDASIKQAEEDMDLQIALALEFDIQTRCE